MSYIKISNPLDKDLTLQFKGDTYEIGANKSESFPEDVSKQWLEIYGFMTESKETVKEVKEVKEEVEVKAKKK